MPMFDEENTAPEMLLKPCPSEYSEQFYQCAFINVPVLIHKIAVRKSVVRNIALIPSKAVFHPHFKLQGAEDFRITDIKVSEPCENECSDLKKLELTIVLEYNLMYWDGFNRCIQPDKAVFKLVLDAAGYPDNKVKCYENKCDKASEMVEKKNRNIKVEALAEAFGAVICPCTGALIIEIGAFFMINYEYRMQLAVPAFQKENVL